MRLESTTTTYASPRATRVLHLRGSPMNPTQATPRSYTPPAPPIRSSATYGGVSRSDTSAMPSHYTPAQSSQCLWDGAQSPPPLIHRLSPYGRVPLPHMVGGPIELNTALSSTFATLGYDITMPPSTAECRDPIRAHGPWLYESATFPQMRSLTIRTEVLERPIIVHASSVNHNAVTVWDILAAVYHALRGAVIEGHRHSHRSHRRSNRQTHNNREHDPYPQVTDEDIRAMVNDFVGSSRYWAGLSPSSSEPDVWILHVR
ncbi:hypothetical protein BDQ12DRAFT_72371 [Crucibulum laeve]|uniref:DUF6699 domain-containing protein n=1 Tax=Crucibulum laeve TaxID=68775 RepID=A0A5C3M212_9AGAR|nr:hypothetical protein BDQ12DRAFT_72371 [Crucibulum laeve]